MEKFPDRAATRYLTPFIIDFARAGADFTGSYDLGLLFMLVALSNVEGMSEELAMERERADEPLPDELRRPLSANAIALELNWPRETARRQVNQLIDKGLLVRVGWNGVIVPASTFRGAAALGIQEAVMTQFYRAMDRMIAAGFVWPPAGPASPVASRFDSLPRFAILRQVMGLALRMTNLSMGAQGRLEAAILLHAITEYNLRALSANPTLSDRFATSHTQAPPDDLREPAPARAIIERTGMSRATVLRLIRQHVESGEIKRVGRGLITSAHIFDAEPRLTAMRVGHGYLQATIGRLAALGVTAEHVRRLAADPGSAVSPRPSGLAKERR